MLPSPTPAPPAPGRHSPAACGSPCGGCRRGQRPSLMLALLAPHTARSSHAPYARRPSGGGWSCGCTWCLTQGRCPTRSGPLVPGPWAGGGGAQLFAWGGTWDLSLEACLLARPSGDTTSVDRALLLNIFLGTVWMAEYRPLLDLSLCAGHGWCRLHWT